MQSILQIQRVLKNCVFADSLLSTSQATAESVCSMIAATTNTQSLFIASKENRMDRWLKTKDGGGKKEKRDQINNPAGGDVSRIIFPSLLGQIQRPPTEPAFFSPLTFLDAAILLVKYKDPTSGLETSSW